MGSGNVILACRTKSDWRDFFAVSEQLHGRDPRWFAFPPAKEIGKWIRRRGSPFLQHATVEAFVCQRDGRPLGRILAIDDRDFRARWGANLGQFGFIDFADEAGVAEALLDAAWDWMRARGAARIQGPFSPSIHHETGILIDRFERPVRIMMPYHPPYIRDRIEACGAKKVEQLLTFECTSLPSDNALLDGPTDCAIRPIDLRKFDAEAERIRLLYNQAWAGNFGMVGIHEREFALLARDMRPLLDDGLGLVAEVNGAVAGVAIALLDANPVLRSLRSAWPGPLQTLRLGWNLLGPPRTHLRKSLRLVLLGVGPDHQRKSIGKRLAQAILARGSRMGATSLEISWVLASNPSMIGLAKSLGAEQVQRHAIYEYPGKR